LQRWNVPSLANAKRTFTGTDEDTLEEYTYSGDYATLTAAKAAFTILDGDHFTLGAVTEPGALDMSGDDCTEANPCVVIMSGDWTQAGAGLTTGDWWEFYCEGNSIVGPVTFGANNVFNRCKLNE
jgi:hypothetical protein